jgi:hypothetical protein
LRKTTEHTTAGNEFLQGDRRRAGAEGSEVVAAGIGGGVIKGEAMQLNRLIDEMCRLDTAAESFEWAEVQKRCPGQWCVPMSVYADIPPAPQREELRALLRAQTPAGIYMVLTLWRLGRGDFGPEDDLLAEYVEAGDSFPNVRKVMDYLAGKRLTRYFQDALQLLREAGIEVDELVG